MTLIDLLAAIGGALILYLLYALGSWAHATFVRGVNLAPYKARGASPHKGDGSEREGASWALVTGATDGIGLAFAHVRLVHVACQSVVHARLLTSYRLDSRRGGPERHPCGAE